MCSLKGKDEKEMVKQTQAKPSSKPKYFRLGPRINRSSARGFDIAIAIILGGISGVYIFNDTMRNMYLTDEQKQQRFSELPGKE